MTTGSKVLSLGRNITILPVIHGSGDFAVEVRRFMLGQSFDCLAVPLPPSFRNEVEAAVDLLPQVSVVLQREPDLARQQQDYDPSVPAAERVVSPADMLARASYVPIDPCQPVIAALRIAMQERISRAYIDPECDHYQPRAAVLPDPYALKRVPVEQFSAAVLPAIPTPEDQGQVQRIHWMASQLHDLSRQHESVLCVCSLVDWPWLRDAFNSAVDCPPAPPQPANPAQIF